VILKITFETRMIMNIGTWLHAYIILKMRGVKMIHFKQQCIYCRAVGMYENFEGASINIFLGIICLFSRHNMPSPGWNRVKRSDKLGGRSSPLPPQAPTALYCGPQ
jgi:hypothetical protein